MKSFNIIFDRSPYFIFIKKHYCTKCGRRLKPVRIMRPLQDDEKRGDEYKGFIHAYGEVENMHFVFKCDHCNQTVTTNEVYESEARRSNSK